MKKIISCLAALTLITAMLPFGNAIAETDKSYTSDSQQVEVINPELYLFGGYVDTESGGLNLRSKPNTNSEIFAVIPGGTQLDIYQSGTNGWYLTIYHNKKGYVSADYIKEIPGYVPSDNESTPNKYGFYKADDIPVTGVSTAALIGEWYDSNNTASVLKITDGSDIYNSKFTFSDGKKTVEGNVKIEYSFNPDLTKSYWYTFYQNDGQFWNGFGVSGVIPINTIASGQDGAMRFIRKNAQKIDLKEITGEWKYQLSDGDWNVDIAVKENGTITVKDDATYTYTGLDGKVSTGTVEADFEEYGTGDKVPIVKFLNKDGKFWIGGYYSSTYPNGILLGNGGMERLVRGDYNKALNEIVIEKMNDMNTIMSVLSGAIRYDKDYSVKEAGKEYYRVTDLTKFTSVKEFKELISKTCTGAEKESAVKECDECFIEKEGVLYIAPAGRGHLTFETGEGVKITEIGENGITAVTVGANQLDGQGRALLTFDGVNWLISSYDFGEVQEDPMAQTAVDKLKDLNNILFILAGGSGMPSDNNIKINNDEYCNVKDIVYDITTLDLFKGYIEYTTTDSLKESLLKQCDSRFVEKNGALYVKMNGFNSLNTFVPRGGIIITDETTEGFTAFTTEANQAGVYGKAVFERSGKGLRISSYEEGLFAANNTTKALQNIAETEMCNLNYILEMLAKGADVNVKDKITVNGVEYGKSEYQDFEPETLKNIIEKTCTGTLKESLLTSCKEHYVKKDGVLYEIIGSKGPYTFILANGVEISDVTADGFTAKTVASNEMFGQGDMEITAVDGKWYVKSYNKQQGTSATTTTTASTTSATTSATTNTTKATDASTTKASATTTTSATAKTTTSSATSKSTETTTTTTATTTKATETSTTTTAASKERIFGDINGDGMIDGRDATALLTYYAKTSTGYAGTLEQFIDEMSSVNK